MRGFVYVLSNQAMPGLVKVGFTTRALAERISELSASSGVPIAFDIEFFVEVEDAALSERLAHAALANRRSSKEFFNCSIAEAVAALKGLTNLHDHRVIAYGGRAESSFATPEEKRDASYQEYRLRFVERASWQLRSEIEGARKKSQAEANADARRTLEYNRLMAKKRAILRTEQQPKDNDCANCCQQSILRKLIGSLFR